MLPLAASAAPFLPSLFFLEHRELETVLESPSSRTNPGQACILGSAGECPPTAYNFSSSAHPHVLKDPLRPEPLHQRLTTAKLCSSVGPVVSVPSSHLGFGSTNCHGFDAQCQAGVEGCAWFSGSLTTQLYRSPERGPQRDQCIPCLDGRLFPVQLYVHTGRWLLREDLMHRASWGD